jgi:hypothetical protein
MLLRAQEWHRGHGDEACVVDGITDSGRGRWQCVRVSIVVRSDGAEALRRTRRRHRGFGEDLMMARALGRSTSLWTPAKFSVGNFGSLTV